MSDRTDQEVRAADARSGPGHRAGAVVIVGDANAGKSTLLNAVLGEKVSIVSPKAHTTRTRILGVHTRPGAQIVFIDTPGFIRGSIAGELQRFIHRTTTDAAGEAELVLLVIDAARFVNRPHAADEVRDMLASRGIARPSVIALNKVDLVEKPALLPLLARLDALWREPGLDVPDIVPVSALKRDGLDGLENALIARLPEGDPLFPEDTLTDQPERVLAAEIVREKLFRQLNQELPYSVAVRVDEWRDEDGLIRIHATIFVERDSQKAIVIGKGGSKLKAVGTAARTELEKLFDAKVFLELFVRVEEQWTRTKRGLLRAGLGEEH